MATVLIDTQRIDTHARIVDCALTKQGHSVVRWFGDDYPARYTSSFRFDSHAINRWQIKSESEKQSFDSDLQVDTVWHRRPRRATTPETIAPDDLNYVEQENAENQRGIWSLVGEDAFWINSKKGAPIASSGCRETLLMTSINDGPSEPDETDWICGIRD